MARVIDRGVLFFGLVSISVDIHSAIEDQSIRTHLLHKKCGSHVRNQIICAVCKAVVERSDLIRGFELSRAITCKSLKTNSRAWKPKPTTELIFVSSCRLKRSIRLLREQLRSCGVEGR